MPFKPDCGSESKPTRSRYVLPANKLPVSLAALRWLKEAKAQYDPSLLYLTQLAAWGLERGIRVVANRVPPEVVEDQVHVFHLPGRPPQAQVNGFRWLLRNPSGPTQAEQMATLERLLLKAQNPMEAATAVLETVSDRIAADRPPNSD